MCMGRQKVMDVQNVLHMNRGEGKTSYAANSQLQRKAMATAKPYLRDTITDLFKKTLPSVIKIADLGCSSGANSLLVISEIIDAITSTCSKQGCTMPEFHIFLNDLPGNDFNNIFRRVPIFLENIIKEKEQCFGLCFVAGVPGSFHGRLFPVKTLNFVHSSYSVMFLSQVPLGVENNHGNIYISATSPPNVAAAYQAQFQKDFTVFLNSRSKEMLSGGRMVITMLGRKSSNPCSEECCYFWDLLAQSLSDLVSQGMVEEYKFSSFNLPWYAPNTEEIIALTEGEGSFQLDSIELVDVDLDKNEGLHSEHFVATMRAVTEPMIISHFGEKILDDLFCKYGERADKFLKEDIKFATLIMCMTNSV